MRAQEGKESYSFGSSMENSKTTAAIQATRQTTPVYKLLNKMLACVKGSLDIVQIIFLIAKLAIMFYFLGYIIIRYQSSANHQ